MYDLKFMIYDFSQTVETLGQNQKVFIKSPIKNHQ